MHLSSTLSFLVLSICAAPCLALPSAQGLQASSTLLYTTSLHNTPYTFYFTNITGQTSSDFSLINKALIDPDLPIIEDGRRLPKGIYVISNTENPVHKTMAAIIQVFAGDGLPSALVKDMKNHWQPGSGRLTIAKGYDVRIFLGSFEDPEATKHEAPIAMISVEGYKCKKKVSSDIWEIIGQCFVTSLESLASGACDAILNA